MCPGYAIRPFVDSRTLMTMLEHPTRLFRARKILTLAGNEPEALVVVGERIVANGPAAELRQRFPSAEQVELGEAVVVPGFTDAHMHPSQAAEDLLHVDVSASSVRSNAEVVKALRRAAEKTAPGSWIRASR